MAVLITDCYQRKIGLMAPGGWGSPDNNYTIVSLVSAPTVSPTISQAPAPVQPVYNRCSWATTQIDDMKAKSP